MSYFDLKLPKPIDGAKTVGDLSDRGCPECGKKLYPEASTGFGSLHCPEHGYIWGWMPTFKEKDGYAPTAWVNHRTRRSSPEFKRRWGKGHS